MPSSCQIGLISITEIDIECEHTKTTLTPKQLSMLVALTKFLTLLKSSKIITFSHLNSTNLSDYFKDNFMREKVNKKASKAKTLIFVRYSLTEKEFMMT